MSEKEIEEITETTDGSGTPAEAVHHAEQRAETVTEETQAAADHMKEETRKAAEQIEKDITENQEIYSRPLETGSALLYGADEENEDHSAYMPHHEEVHAAEETVSELFPEADTEETAAEEVHAESVHIEPVMEEQVTEEAAPVQEPVYTVPAAEKKEAPRVEEQAVKEERQTAPAYTYQEPYRESAQAAPARKSHPVLNTLLSAAVSLAAGFGGGYLAVRTFAPETPEPAVADAVPETEPEEQAAAPLPAEPEPAPVVSTEMSISDIAAKAQPSVVEILIEAEVSGGYGGYGGWGGFFNQPYTTQAAGSGVIISDDGYIITNNHVVEDATKITVTLFDGREYEAELIGTDAKSDIGVIKISADNLTAAEIGDSDTLQTGDTAVVIGNPLGTLGGTVTNGIISATDREITIDDETMNLIQTNAAINSGNSGGGLFDGHGDLIGIVNAKDSGYTSSGTVIEGLGFAIPVNEAMDIAEQLIEYGAVTNRATLGVYIQELAQSTGNYEAGLYITEVMKNSGAEEAGLQSYDRIVSADGQQISGYKDLRKVLKEKNVGDTIEVTVVRDGEEMTFECTLTGPISDTYEG